jgi:hypothetical protein
MANNQATNSKIGFKPNANSDNGEMTIQLLLNLPGYNEYAGRIPIPSEVYCDKVLSRF